MPRELSEKMKKFLELANQFYKSKEFGDDGSFCVHAIEQEMTYLDVHQISNLMTRAQKIKAGGIIKLYGGHTCKYSKRSHSFYRTLQVGEDRPETPKREYTKSPTTADIKRDGVSEVKEQVPMGKVKEIEIRIKIEVNDGELVVKVGK